MKANHLWIGAVVCACAATSHAAGDRTQGTNVCGAGLEHLDASGRSTGNCLAVASASLLTGSVALNDAKGSKITLDPANCDKTKAYWSCSGASFDSLSVSGEQFCAVAPGTPVRLIFLRAKLANGSFAFNLTGRHVAVVCGGSQFAPPPASAKCSVSAEKYSTADDCIWWGYAPTEDPKKQRTFNACVRMARADYLGNGKSSTRFGIHIQPYNGIGGDQPECQASQAACNGCFEASWDETGATCVAHYRVTEVLDRLVQFAGYDKEMAKQLFEKRFGPTTGDAPYVCVRKGDAKALAKALLMNRSRIHQCTGGPVPTITDCHTTSPDPCPIPPPPGQCPPP